MSELNKVFTYLDVPVYLLGDSHQFFVEELDNTTFDSARDARDAIEKHKARKSKLVKLSLEVINGEGEKCVITGIHASTGKKLITPRQDRSSNFYPNAPVVVNAIALQKELTAKLRLVTNVLCKFEIVGDPYIGSRNLDVEKRQAEVVNDVTQKNKLAAGAMLGEELNLAKPRATKMDLAV
jgi:hypothetical protein